jgi:2-amino-4-hydroxy-6-hydroxymethyldihydropteridine diphosphokinase
MDLYLALGGNLGDVKLTFIKAISRLSEELGELISYSSLYKTKPLVLDIPSSTIVPDYFNMACRINTSLDHISILKICLEIEKQLGRNRDPNNQYASRNIDIDLIFLDQLVFKNSNLCIPHPRYRTRDFVLLPLLELNPNLIDPEYNLPVKSYIEESKETFVVSIERISI